MTDFINKITTYNKHGCTCTYFFSNLVPNFKIIKYVIFWYKIQNTETKYVYVQ